MFWHRHLLDKVIQPKVFSLLENTRDMKFVVGTLQHGILLPSELTSTVLLKPSKMFGV
jgi:hypothetical protein